MRGIPKYFISLENAHKYSKRAGNLIMEGTLHLIATNTMLLTERYPQVDKRWEYLPKKENAWTAWKNMYKAADRKAKVKK